MRRSERRATRTRSASCEARPRDRRAAEPARGAAALERDELRRCRGRWHRRSGRAAGRRRQQRRAAAGRAPCRPSSASCSAAFARRAARCASPTSVPSTPTATWRRSRGSARAPSWCRSASIAAVFEEVERGHAEFGVVPIENSTDGRVADSLECLARPHVAANAESGRRSLAAQPPPQSPASLQICGEVPLRIHHCLLGRGSAATSAACAASRRPSRSVATG